MAIDTDTAKGYKQLNTLIQSNTKSPTDPGMSTKKWENPEGKMDIQTLQQYFVSSPAWYLPFY